VSRCVPPTPGITPSLISAEPNFGGCRRRVKVAHHRQLAPTPTQTPAPAADDRLAHARDVLPARDEIAEEASVKLLSCMFLDVAAGGGERLLGAGQHDRPIRNRARKPPGGVEVFDPSAGVQGGAPLGRFSRTRPTRPWVRRECFRKASRISVGSGRDLTHSGAGAKSRLGGSEIQRSVVDDLLHGEEGAGLATPGSAMSLSPWMRLRVRHVSRPGF